jgi:hypothetical protein
MNVQRVRGWRAAHPGYWRRSGTPTKVALQEDSMTQATETNKKSANLVDPALQDLLFDQPVVLIGLIANLTGTALQEAMPHAA